MKRKLFGLAVGLIALSSLLFVGIGHAATMRSGASADIAKGETVNSSVYLAGTNVTIAGTVRGDVFCAGQSVVITGVVQGDVLCAGQTMRIEGSVLGNVRAAAQTLTVTGSVNGNITLAGQTVTLAAGSSVGQDVTAFATNLQLQGHVGRDVVGGGQIIHLSATIGRDAELTGSAITLGSGSRIARNLTYSSETSADIQAGAIVDGATAHKIVAEHRTNEWSSALDKAVYWFVALALLGGALALLTPKVLPATRAAFGRKLWQALIAGALLFVVSPLVVLVLVLTIFGIPLAVALMLLLAVVGVVGLLAGSHAVGAWIIGRFDWKQQQFSALLFGLGITMLVGVIPFIGGLLVSLLLVAGMGSVVLSYWSSRRMGSGKRTTKTSPAR